MAAKNPNIAEAAASTALDGTNSKNTENIKAAAEGFRMLAEQRHGGATAENLTVASRSRDAGVVLMPETADIYVEAEALLETIEHEENAALVAKVSEDAAKYLYFIKCRETHLPNEHGRKPPQHGVYLTRNPGEGELTLADFFATYKKQGDTKFRGEIVCQVCQERDIQVPLSIVWTDMRKGIFRVDPRWLWQRDRKTGLETRAVTMRHSASNSWMEKPVEPVKAAMAGV